MQTTPAHKSPPPTTEPPQKACCRRRFGKGHVAVPATRDEKPGGELAVYPAHRKEQLRRDEVKHTQHFRPNKTKEESNAASSSPGTPVTTGTWYHELRLRDGSKNTLLEKTQERNQKNKENTRCFLWCILPTTTNKNKHVVFSPDGSTSRRPRQPRRQLPRRGGRCAASTATAVAAANGGPAPPPRRCVLLLLLLLLRRPPPPSSPFAAGAAAAGATSRNSPPRRGGSADGGHGGRDGVKVERTYRVRVAAAAAAWHRLWPMIKNDKTGCSCGRTWA